MGQPSFQASNAIIYVTYGVFLYAPPLTYARLSNLTFAKAPLIIRVMQARRPLHCLALEASIQVGLPGNQPNTEGLDLLSLTNLPSYLLPRVPDLILLALLA